MRTKYLLPEPDGLPTRESHNYARYKHATLQHYLSITNTAMRSKPWASRNYIDLQAGPGKITIGNETLLGSPLIALRAPYPADHFFFNELNESLCSALAKRVSASPLAERVTILNADLNEIITQVCDEIRQQDRAAQQSGRWSTLNVAFLDPEGLELHWDTVAQLAKMKRMDLIITFPTGGLLRTIGKGYYDSVSKFFGTPEWKTAYEAAGTMRKRALIDFYRQKLEQFGYNIEIDPEWGSHDLRVKNSKNVEVYSLVFASKHPLGDKLWKEAGDSSQPRRLPGL